MKIFKNGYSEHYIVAFVLWILTFVWFSLCIGFSSQSGEETGKLSMSLASFLGDALRIPKEWFPVLNRILRKIAHIVCFSVLSILAGGASTATFPKNPSAFLWVLPPCAVFAFIDEVRKTNIPGRHCSIPEAWLNVAGCVLGTVLLGIILCMLHQRK